MDFNKMNEDWKIEAPKLAAMQGKNPFLTPENYFNDLSAQLQSRIAVENYIKNQESGFVAPEAYFNTLSNHIEDRIFAEELRQSVSDPGFTVPDGYFDMLQAQISVQVMTEDQAKVVSIRRRKAPAWINYAAAACVTLAVSAGIFVNYQNNQIENQLSTISEAEIVNYLQLHSDNADTQIIYDNLGQNFTLAPVQDFSNGEIQQYQEYLDSTL